MSRIPDTRRTTTDDVIRSLAGQAVPVRPLSSPLLRTLAWLAFAAMVILAVTLFQGLRADLLPAITAPWGAIELAASLATGVSAAYAAFQVSVPGRSRRWTWLPIPFLLLWLGGLGMGCLADAARLGAAAFDMRAAVGECARAIALTSLPLLAGMLLMLRHASAAGAAPSAWLAMLSAAALSAVGVTLIHPGETAWMVLVFHLGAVLVLSLGCLAINRPLFAWIAPARPAVEPR